MTVNQVIARVSALKPSPFADVMIAGWLYELEGKIALEFIHQRAPEPQLPQGPPEQTPEAWDLPLAAPYPYDNFYELYVMAMVDFYLREYDQYQNSRALFLSAWEDFTRWHIRKYEPLAVAGLSGVM